MNAIVARCRAVRGHDQRHRDGDDMACPSAAGTAWSPTTRLAMPEARDGLTDVGAAGYCRVSPAVPARASTTPATTASPRRGPVPGGLAVSVAGADAVAGAGGHLPWRLPRAWTRWWRPWPRWCEWARARGTPRTPEFQVPAGRTSRWQLRRTPGGGHAQRGARPGRRQPTWLARVFELFTELRTTTCILPERELVEDHRGPRLHGGGARRGERREPQWEPATGRRGSTEAGPSRPSLREIGSCPSGSDPTDP
ncbi:hypothetical protein QJS66_10455 [Kocuria rhizophila]|nr:hypothetical protein QJS66_10455 [Kocuria rhizophila]